MPHSGLKKCHIVAVPPLKEGWEFRKVKEWVDHAGGKITFQPEVDEQTTHIVIGEKKWRQQDGFVMSVLDHKQQTGQQIDIVNYDWLEKSLEKRSKKREGPYCWEKMDKNMMRARHRSEKEQAKLDKANNPRTTSGLMKEVFTDSTDAFVDEKEKRRMERRMIEEEKLRKEAEDEKKQAYQRQRDQMRVKEVAAVFRRGVQKSRNELLSDNHHIYTDDTGFHFDVLITKVDTRNNRNERYALTLQIFESNEQPETYAVNCKFAGTNRLPENNVIACIGSNFHTALSAFKKIFKEKTQVDWNDRVNAALENRKREMRGQCSAKKKHSKMESDDFSNMPFQYHPPLSGPRGSFPKADDPQQWLDFDPPREDAAIPPQQQQEQSPADDGPADVLMSGSNGERESLSSSQSFSKDMPSPPKGLDYDQALKADRAREEGLGTSSFDEPFDYGRSMDLADSNDPVSAEKTSPTVNSESDGGRIQKRKASSLSKKSSGKKARIADENEPNDVPRYTFDFGEEAEGVMHGDPRDDSLLIDTEEAERAAAADLRATMSSKD